MKLLMAALVGLLAIPCAAAPGGYEELIKKTAPKIVTIEVTGEGLGYETMFSSAPTKRKMKILGSGAIINPDGFVLTCYHLFDDPLEGRTITVKMASGYGYRATLIADNPDRDLALLKIYPMKKLPYLTVGKQPQKGQPVLSFGSPMGFEKSVSFGHVENTDILVSKSSYTLHSAGLNPGNSGGPLINNAGELVGVNVAHLMTGMFMRGEGLNLAVPMRDIRKFLGL